MNRPNEIAPSIELYNKPIYLYIKPKNITPQRTGLNEFYNEVTLFHTIGEKVKKSHPAIADDINNKYYDFEDVHLVSTVYINPHTDIEEMILTDTRTRGGGIREDIVKKVLRNDQTEEIEKLIGKHNSYWDFRTWEGEPYPVNGVVVIELPKTILDIFTKKEVYKKIEKHIAYGVFPVIKYV
jgi:hypothetical protein